MREQREKHGHDNTGRIEGVKKSATATCSSSKVISARGGVISGSLQHITQHAPQSMSSLYPCNVQRGVSSQSSCTPPLLPCDWLSPGPQRLTLLQGRDGAGDGHEMGTISECPRVDCAFVHMVSV